MARDSPDRYLPSDDTSLLIDALTGASGGRLLEIGFGSGAVLSGIAGRFELAVGTDIVSLQQARMSLRGNPGQEVLADKATCFRDSSFDLVTFNPPYLPSDGIQDGATDGGEGGVVTPIAFLDEAVRVLKPGGKVVLLLSDRSDIKRFLEHAASLGLLARESRRKRLFYETLVTFELSSSNPDSLWRSV